MSFYSFTINAENSCTASYFVVSDDYEVQIEFKYTFLVTILKSLSVLNYLIYPCWTKALLSFGKKLN